VWLLRQQGDPIRIQHFSKSRRLIQPRTQSLGADLVRDSIEERRRKSRRIVARPIENAIRPVRMCLNRSRPTLRNGMTGDENPRVGSDPRERAAFGEIREAHGTLSSYT